VSGEASQQTTAQSAVEGNQSSSRPSETPSSQPSSSSSTIDESFFHSELFDHYDKIYTWLRFAGLKRANKNTYTLWELAIKGRSLTIVYDPGLHLVWKGSIQYIKPLPACFADDDIIETLSEKSGEDLKHARGFFHSYTDIIKSELDYEIARKFKILPEPWLSRPVVGEWKGWESWRALSDKWRDENNLNENVEVSSDGRHHRPPLPSNCHRRYEYHELRLARLNWIMWFRYLPHYFQVFQVNNYKPHFYVTQDAFGTFWHGYGKWIAILFAYSTILMTAMLVALAANDVPQWFRDGCSVISYILITLVIFHATSFIAYILLWGFDQAWRWLRIQIRNMSPDVQE
jgi:hypothetical protein